MAKERVAQTQKTEMTIGTRRDLFAAEEQRRATLRYLTPEVIDPNPDQPRQTVNRETLEELKKSIAERGILQPLLAVKGMEGHVTLVAGQRRLMAARELGLKLVPVMVIDYRPDVAFDAIIENIQREALDPIDEGEAFQKLSEERNLSHAEIGARIGKSKQYVTDRVRLSQRLTPRTKELITAVVQQSGQSSNISSNARAFNSEISNEEAAQGAKAKFTIARAISFLPENLQEAAMAELESEVTRLGRRLTTREVEELVAHFKLDTPRRRMPVTPRRAEPAPDGLIQMSFLAEEEKKSQVGTRNSERLSPNGGGTRNSKAGRQRAKIPAAKRVDGRELQSFRVLAEMLHLTPDQALNLDIDTAIKMMEADLERLRQLKKIDE
jgi:ParB/RepB/Spo0J family partition protein